MKVCAVSDRRLQDAFIRLPWRIYRGDPAWVPPLASDMRNQMRSHKNPFHKHALIEHFVALGDGDDPVGRVAATVFPKPTETGWTGEGAFGFFECVDDPTVAEALLRAAEGWLQDRGCTVVVGPYSYCATQECGLLVDGFDMAPSVFQTHNPPYYEALLRHCGYQTKYGATAYTFTMSSFVERTGGDPGDPVKALTDGPLRHAGEAFRQSRDLVVRRLDMRHYGRDMEIIRRLLNTAFAGNEGVLPVSDDVFSHQVGQLKPFVDPSLIAIVELLGEPVAFTFLVPDVNVILKRLNGRLTLWSLLTLKSSLKALDRAVVLLVGTLPRRSLAGVSRLLVAELVAALGHGGYREVTTTWVHDANRTIHKFAENLGGKASKRYAILKRSLA